MRFVLIFYLMVMPFNAFAIEWKSLKSYQKETHKQELQASDWLTSDRKQNTPIWKNANCYNLTHHKSEEYQTIKQRSDFYNWVYETLKAKGHEVIWPAMASLISGKLQLTQDFPQCLLIRKKVKYYAKLGSEIVFKNSFEDLNAIYNTTALLKDDEALQWDETMLYKEQFVYLETIYKTIDRISLHQIERIAKGKFLYAFVVPRAIRFKGDISKPHERYNFALNDLKPYCENRYQ